MNRTVFLIAAVILALIPMPAVAMQDHNAHGTHGAQEATPMKKAASNTQPSHGGTMDHQGMGGTFKHMASEGGIEAAFQVMSLASMNMTSDKGDTHHIMVDLKSTDGTPIKNAVGKIKVIAPDKSEQVSPLKNYSGILAGNFTFTEPGKYGVICLLKVGDEKQVFRFWYPHMQQGG